MNNTTTTNNAPTTVSPVIRPSITRGEAQAVRLNVLNSSVNEATNQQLQLRSGPVLTYLTTLIHIPQILVAVIYLIVALTKYQTFIKSNHCERVVYWVLIQALFLFCTLAIHWMVFYVEGYICWTPFRQRRQQHRRNHAVPTDSSEHGTTATTHPVSPSVSNRQTSFATRRQQRESLRLEYLPFLNHGRYFVELCTLLWFVVGNMWLISEQGQCHNLPIYHVMIGLVIVSYVEIFLPCILLLALLPILCFCLPCVIRLLRYLQDPMRGKGASKDIISKLTSMKYGKEFMDYQQTHQQKSTTMMMETTESEYSCCICLNEYEMDQELRILPCHHHFHRDCVDEWLVLNATCPTCRCSILPENEQTPRNEDQLLLQERNDENV